MLYKDKYKFSKETTSRKLCVKFTFTSLKFTFKQVGHIQTFAICFTKKMLSKMTWFTKQSKVAKMRTNL